MYASDMLQSAKIDLSKALDLINNLVETFQKHRTETTFFESIWKEAENLSHKCCIDKDVQRKITRSKSVNISSES